MPQLVSLYSSLDLGLDMKEIKTRALGEISGARVHFFISVDHSYHYHGFHKPHRDDERDNSY